MKAGTHQTKAANFISSESLFLPEASLELSLLCIHGATSSPTCPTPLSQLCLDLASLPKHSCQLFKGKKKGVSRI